MVCSVESGLIGGADRCSRYGPSDGALDLFLCLIVRPYEDRTLCEVTLLFGNTVDPVLGLSKSCYWFSYSASKTICEVK